MHDAVAVALKLAACYRGGLVMDAAARGGLGDGIGGELQHAGS
jgi:hypothetical protein